MKSNLVTLVILAVILGLAAPADAVAEFTFPAGGYSDQLVVDFSDQSPTAIAWLPAAEQGDLLIATQQGGLFRRSGTTTSATLILDLTGNLCAGGETGLLGLAVDPSFQSGQRFVYLYYTDRQGNGDCGNPSDRANRVSRFRMNDQHQLVDEQVLIDNIPAPNGNHNGGDLQFDNAGLLYVSVGDGGRDLRTGVAADGNGNARRLDLLLGKILRIEPDGDIPTGNPFFGAGTARCAATGGLEAQSQGVKAEKQRSQAKKHRKARKQRRKKRRNQAPPVSATVCQEIFATGLRNPYRIAFDQNDNQGQQRFFINDVGGAEFEEIDNGIAGADYGWNLREGPCPIGQGGSNCSPDGRFVDPVFAFGHGNGGEGFADCRVITGGAFAPAGAGWPGEYLFADFGCDRLFSLQMNGATGSAAMFGRDEAATHLAFGPDGALYYTTFAQGGQVRKIFPDPA